MSWRNLENIGSKTFTCGWCGNIVASVFGYRLERGIFKIYICPFCQKPTFTDDASQLPGVSPGNEVAHLPHDVGALFKEARNCCAASCYTAAVLICRKLLMNIAVSQGAEEGKSFMGYVEYLSASGYVPPNGKGWVDHIRRKGNEATHEISFMSQDDANDLLSFSEMLLKFIYEFPNKVPQPPS